MKKYQINISTNKKSVQIFLSRLICYFGTYFALVFYDSHKMAEPILHIYTYRQVYIGAGREAKFY